VAGILGVMLREQLRVPQRLDHVGMTQYGPKPGLWDPGRRLLALGRVGGIGTANGRLVELDDG
jgi:hypothetical protein